LCFFVFLVWLRTQAHHTIPTNESPQAQRATDAANRANIVLVVL